jgi:hypothetical protein
MSRRVLSFGGIVAIYIERHTYNRSILHCFASPDSFRVSRIADEEIETEPRDSTSELSALQPFLVGNPAATIEDWSEERQYH